MSDSSKNIVEFALIYNRHKTKLFNYALKMLGDKLTCEDIIQNVFLKLFENLDVIRNQQSIQFWLFRTARNEIYTYYRNKKTHVDQFKVQDADEIDLDSSIKLDEEFELKEMKEFIMKELNNIAVEQRDVFLLKEYGGLSYKEIGEVMNIDEVLVKSRLYNTRQKLFDKLSKIFLNERQ